MHYLGNRAEVFDQDSFLYISKGFISRSLCGASCLVLWTCPKLIVKKSKINVTMPLDLDFRCI